MGLPLRWIDIVEVPEKEPEIKEEVRKSKPMNWAFVFVGMGITVIIATVATAFALARPWNRPPELHFVAVTSGAEGISLARSSAVRQVGYVTVSGSATNRSNHNLPRLEAVVELLDHDRQPIQIESAIVSREALPNGKTAPFSVEMADDSHADSYRIYFRQMGGPSLH